MWIKNKLKCQGNGKRNIKKQGKQKTKNEMVKYIDMYKEPQNVLKTMKRYIVRHTKPKNSLLLAELYYKKC